MHACGHDMHTTWLLATMAMIHQYPVNKNIRFIFQPAEEIGQGALSMIGQGALENVTEIYGAHADTSIPVGKVIVQAGSVAAASDLLEFTIKGKACHAARPHQGKDPFIPLSFLIQSLQHLITRSIDPQNKAIISLGTIHGGIAHNIIPEIIQLNGTLRTLDTKVQSKLHRLIKNICQNMAKTYGVQIKCNITPRMPILLNHSKTTKKVIESIKGSLLVKENCQLKTNFAGEDFAFYSQRVPATFFRVGAQLKPKDTQVAHCPTYQIDEESIWVAADIFYQIIQVSN